jgi:hypothetical protein
MKNIDLIELSMLLADENLLINNAASYDISFEIRGILKLIRSRKERDVNLVLCQIEDATVLYYKSIKADTNLIKYSTLMHDILQVEMTEKNVNILEKLLCKMQDDLTIEQTQRIVIKNLR